MAAPLDIVFDEYDVVQPDVVFFRVERRHLVQLDAVTRDAPDIAVEVLSPSTAVTDRGRKMQMFARYGVLEYWIVDPNNRTADLHVLAKESITYCVETCVTEIRFAKVNAVVNLGRVWL